MGYQAAGGNGAHHVLTLPIKHMEPDVKQGPWKSSPPTKKLFTCGCVLFEGPIFARSLSSALLPFSGGGCPSHLQALVLLMTGGWGGFRWGLLILDNSTDMNLFVFHRHGHSWVTLIASQA